MSGESSHRVALRATGTSARTSWFERHPRLTIAGTIAALLGVCDVVAARLLEAPPAEIAHGTGELAAFERALGIRGHRVADPFFHHGLKPNDAFKDLWGERELQVFTNSLGLKDARQRFVPPRTQKRRIVFLGDSFVEGVGLEWEKTFVGLVAGRLDPKRFEVLDAGVSGYSPKLYWLKLRWLLERAQLRIDEVWVFLDMSDVHNEIEYETFVSALDERPPSRAAHLADSAWHAFAGASFIARTAEAALHEAQARREHERLALLEKLEDEMYAFDSDPDVRRRWGGRGVELAERYMQKLVDLCRNRGIRVGIAVYPHHRQVLDEDRQEPWVRRWEAFARRNGTAFLDLFRTFFDPALAARFARPGMSTYFGLAEHHYFRYDAHWNEEGHRLVADQIAIE